jgi:hypothetical protein
LYHVTVWYPSEHCKVFEHVFRSCFGEHIQHRDGPNTTWRATRDPLCKDPPCSVGNMWDRGTTGDFGCQDCPDGQAGDGITCFACTGNRGVENGQCQECDKYEFLSGGECHKSVERGQAIDLFFAVLLSLGSVVFPLVSYCMLRRCCRKPVRFTVAGELNRRPQSWRAEPTATAPAATVFTAGCPVALC